MRARQHQEPPGRFRYAVRLAWAALLGALPVTLSGCIAPDINVIGGVGFAVDDQGRLMVVVEGCGRPVVRVHMAYNREGLTSDEEPNEEIGEWTLDDSQNPPAQLVISDPGPEWTGSAVRIDPERGVIADGLGERSDVLTQASLAPGQIPQLEPGKVYYTPRGDPVAVAGTRAEFTAWACSDRDDI
ncbi:hypothetical protein ACQBAT_01745 [Ornithinimicrobium sp. Y1847]|uniref:hypothetical protein n=1 Tax=Ornithinimicrobium sp. Y1847 TaxID=3405419 RepID=UPI003B67D569